MPENKSVNIFPIIILFIYGIILFWWLILQAGTDAQQAYLFNWSYGIIGLLTAAYAIKLSFDKWGGYKSILGRGLIFLAGGLFGQWLGLQIWTYYNVIAKVEVPYPSLADFGYFALIPFYSLAAWMFAKASGAKFSLRTTNGKVFALFIPFIWLLISYLLFLKNVGIDWSDPIKTFLDTIFVISCLNPIKRTDTKFYIGVRPKGCCEKQHGIPRLS